MNAIRFKSRAPRRRAVWIALLVFGVSLTSLVACELGEAASDAHGLQAYVPESTLHPYWAPFGEGPRDSRITKQD